MTALIDFAETGFWKMLPHLSIATVGGLALLVFSKVLKSCSSGKQQVLLWSGLLCFILPLPWIASKFIDQLPEEPNRLINFEVFNLLVNPELYKAKIGTVEALVSMGAKLDVVLLSLICLLVGVWFLGTVSSLLILFARSIQHRFTVQKLGEKMEYEYQRRIDFLTLGMEIYSPVTGYWMPQDSWLGVVGIFNSKIMIPRGLCEGLSLDEFDSLLVHEIAHVKRRDNFRRWFQSVIVCMFWFHPVVRILHQSLIWESERACDEMVVEHGVCRKRYEKSLIKSVCYSLDISLIGASGMSRSNLDERLTVLQNYKRVRLSILDSAIFVSSLLLVFGVIGIVAAQGSLTNAAVEFFSLEEGEFLSQMDQVAYDAPKKKFNALNEHIAQRSHRGVSSDFVSAVFNYKLGNYKNATRYAERALTKYPGCFEAYELAGYASMHLEQFDRAGTFFAAAIELDEQQGSYSLFGVKGYCHLRCENYDSALISFEKALASEVITENDRVNYLRGLAKSYWKSGDEKKARQLFTKLLSEDPFFRDFYLAILSGDAPSSYLNI